VAKKDEKTVAAVKRPNFIKRYVTETVGELRKVTWPTRKEASNLTVIVIVVIVIMGMFLGVLDFIYTKFFALLFA
jgi:preprotein translocase subunit SecE